MAQRKILTLKKEKRNIDVTWSFLIIQKYQIKIKANTSAEVNNKNKLNFLLNLVKLIYSLIIRKLFIFMQKFINFYLKKIKSLVQSSLFFNNWTICLIRSKCLFYINLIKSPLFIIKNEIMQSSLRCYQKYSTSGKIASKALLKHDNYNYKQQIQHFIQDSISSNIKNKCPIKKIIRLLNNLLKLNNFQCSLLCWLLKKSSSNLNQQIKQLADNDIEEVDALDDVFEKKVFLVLLLNGYYVKNNFFINKGEDIDIQPNLFENIKNFHMIYKCWKPQISLKNVSLNEINHIFESWNYTKNLKSKIDYNKIVDKILFLSKTYNVGVAQETVSVKQTKSEKVKENYGKKRKLNEEISKQKRIKQKDLGEKDIQYDQSPLKNSVSNKIPWFQQERNNTLLNPLRRSTRTMNKSIFQMKQDRQDLNPNESLFNSFRSRDSGHEQNMFNSLKNTSNNNNFGQLFNNSFVGLNSNQSTFGFGNMFKSCIEEDVVIQKNDSKGSIKNTEQKQKKLTNSRTSKKKDQLKQLKLKPTTSYDQFLK